MQGLIRRYSLKSPPRMLDLGIRTKMLHVVDETLENHRKWPQCVFFLCHVMMTYFLLGATSQRRISALRRGGSSYGAHTFLMVMLSDSQWITSARIGQGYPQPEMFNLVSRVGVWWFEYRRWDALIQVIRCNMYGLAS